jgi:hypothetical protein
MSIPSKHIDLLISYLKEMPIKSDRATVSLKVSKTNKFEFVILLPHQYPLNLQSQRVRIMQPLNTIRQLGYVVTDLDKAIKYWVETLNVGPFFMFEHCPLDDQLYRGNPANVDVDIALGNSGDLQIELICQNNDEPSVYKEAIDAGRVGLHHFGLMPTDYESAKAQYRSLGHDAAFECNLGGSELIYFDTIDSVGHYTELWQNSQAFNDIALIVENAAKNWNGLDPIRPAPG